MRALAISADGTQALSGSFDTSAIRWSLRAQRRRAGAALPRRRRQCGGDPAGRPHRDRAARTAASRSGRRASRSRRWCSKATRRRSWRLRFRPTARRSPPPPGITPCGCGRSPGGAPRVLEGHQQNVNGVAFTPDGRAWSAPAMTRPCASGRWTAARPTSSRCRRRSMPSRSRPTARSSRPAPTARSISCPPRASPRARSRPAPTPIIAVAMSGDGTLVAAAGIRGSVAIIERATRKLARTLVGPGPAGLVARLLARQPHAAHRRRRPHGPALGRGHRRADRQRGVGRAGRPARGLSPAIPAPKSFAPASPATP